MRHLLLPLFLLHLPSRSSSFGTGTFTLPFLPGAAFSPPKSVFLARGCPRTRSLAGSAASPSPRPPALALQRAVPARHILALSRMISSSASEGADGPPPPKKQCSVSGMRYRVDEAGTLSSPRTHAIFLHGLSSSSETCQVPKDVLDLGATWLVPDLMGHGDSPRPVEPESYTMQRQAENVHRVLVGEKVKELFIVAHSMSGPIAALTLIDLCKDSGITVKSLVYEEGNIDYGDCFGSQKLVDAGPGDTAESAALYHSAVDLVGVSKEGGIWPKLKREMQAGLKVTFTFGEKNRGRFTSERLLREEGVEIEWMPGGGHSMHRDDASHHFWKLIGRLMREDAGYRDIGDIGDPCESGGGVSPGSGSPLMSSPAV